MKLLLMSDTHGALSMAQKIIKTEQADVVLHMGDVGFDPAYLDYVYYVKGNHDEDLQEPKEKILTFLQKKIYLIHGDLFEREVFANLSKMNTNSWIDMKTCKEEYMRVMRQIGKVKQVDIVCFGHTHQPMIQQIDGLWIINPGSLAIPYDGKNISYAILYIEGNRIEAVLKNQLYDEK